MSLFSLKDSPWRWAAGVQAALANALPMAVFYLAGHLPLGIISSLGAFTALYGTTMPLRERCRILPSVASAFIAASALGVLCARIPALMVVCVISVAVAASVLVFGLGLGPPGPMQFVLVASASARLAIAASASSSVSANVVPLLVASGALSAYAVVAAPLALTKRWNSVGNTSPSSALFSLGKFDEDNLLITARVSLAVAVAAVFAAFSRASHGYWIIMVAGALLQATRVSRDTARRAAHRVLGTVAGVGVFGAIRWFDPRGGWLLVVLVVLQFAIEVVVARHYALALTFITPTALIIAATGTMSPSALVQERILDTVLGALISLMILWITDWMYERYRARDARTQVG